MSGKTFEMREFGAEHYKNTIYVNFETDERKESVANVCYIL